MPSPNKPPFDSETKAKLTQSGSHPIVRPAPGSLQGVKTVKVGSGQTWTNLMKSDVDAYARAQAGDVSRVEAGPGLIRQLISRVRRTFIRSPKNL